MLINKSTLIAIIYINIVILKYSLGILNKYLCFFCLRSICGTDDEKHYFLARSDALFRYHKGIHRFYFKLFFIRTVSY